MPGPEGDKLIRVNMTDQTVAIEEFPEAWKLHGGRSLSAKILLQDCDPACAPPGPVNSPLIAPRVLSGTTAPTLFRTSIGRTTPPTRATNADHAAGRHTTHLL